MAASGQPALGERCFFASRHTVFHASFAEAPTPFAVDPESQYMLDVNIRQLRLGDGVRGFPTPEGSCLLLGDMITVLDLPVKVEVKAFKLAELVLGEALAGQPARLAADGRAKLGAPSEGLDLDLKVRRLDAASLAPPRGGAEKRACPGATVRPCWCSSPHRRRSSPGATGHRSASTGSPTPS